MAVPPPADDLDARAGRGPGTAARTSDRPTTRASTPGGGRRHPADVVHRLRTVLAERRGPVLAGGLVVALALAWVAIGRSDPAPPAPAAAPDRAATATAPVTAAPPDTAGLRARLGDPASCADAPGPVPRITCTGDGVTVDAQLLDPARAAQDYAIAAGVAAAPHAGPPACARGEAEERSWARPGSPNVVAGRYACRTEGAEAVLWWTDEQGVLARAGATGRGLADLFAWWQAHLTG